MKVLVVDPDQTLLPEVYSTLAAQPGLDVYCAESATAAIDYANALNGIDLLLTDAFLPGMDGFALFNTLHGQYPSLRIAFLTAYDLSAYSSAVAGSPVLQRPIDPEQLIAILKPSLQAHNKRPLPLAEGQNIGTFHLLRFADRKGVTSQFAAVQTGLNRTSLITILDLNEAQNPEVRESFLADASAKARIMHPTVLAVYEAGEADGWTYYASERIEAPSLQMLLDRNDHPPHTSIERVAHAVAEFQRYLQVFRIPHTPLSASDILLSADGFPRVINPGVALRKPLPEESESIALFGQILLSLLPKDTPSELHLHILRTQKDHPKRIRSWKEFLTFFDHSASAETPTAEDSKKTDSTPASLDSPKTSVAAGFGISILAVAAIAFGLFWFQKSADLKKPNLPESVAIPKGRYMIGSGTPTDLPAFWIDRTEISVGQYAVFLNWLATHPNEANSFNHPEQPADHPHKPPLWDDSLTPLALSKNAANEPRLQLPITNVSWWNAFAFAKWAGRELPSPETWEAAARGSKGLLFPWGDNPMASKANVLPSANNTTTPSGEPGPTPVFPSTDVSPFGVLNMAGNVAEWTNSRTPEQNAVVKGSHFGTHLSKLNEAETVPPSERRPTIGFRTISLTPPKT